MGAQDGDKADSLILIVKGRVQLCSMGQPPRILTEGHSFGEREFLGVSERRTATVTTLTFCDVRIMYRRALESTLARIPKQQQAYPSFISSWAQRPGAEARRLMMFFTSECANALQPHLPPLHSPSMKTSTKQFFRRTSLGTNALEACIGHEKYTRSRARRDPSSLLQKIGSATVNQHVRTRVR